MPGCSHTWPAPAPRVRLVVQPAIYPAIADMRQRKALAAKHQALEGGQQRLAAAIGLQPAIPVRGQTLEAWATPQVCGVGVAVQVRPKVERAARPPSAHC